VIHIKTPVLHPFWVVLEGIFKSGCGKAWRLIGFPQGIFASSRPKNVEFSTGEMEAGTKI
jgi:hypothetical protein